MIYPFLIAYLKATGKIHSHIFAKMTPFSLKSDNYSKVYIIEPGLEDKLLSRYHLYNSNTLVEFIQKVGRTKTSEVIFITDRKINMNKLPKSDFDRDAKNIASLLPDDIICKYYCLNGLLVYCQEEREFKPSSTYQIKINHKYHNGIEVIETLKKELGIKDNLKLMELKSII